MNHMKEHKGFTLIELLIVIAVIALLAGLAVFSLTRAQSTARDSQVFKDIKTLQTALEFYYTENGQYPVMGEGAVWTNTSEPGLGQELAEYLDGMPVSPRDDEGQAYTYVVSENGEEYFLAAALENEKHDALVNDLDTQIGGAGWLSLTSRNESAAGESVDCDDANGAYCVSNE